ncbi:MAG: HNH endonuclease signature motif containing protein [Bdellovibrionota bacterium]
MNTSINLKKLSDQNLIFNTEKLVQQERELLTNVLTHLREIERRRLFSALGYKSLFDFSIRRLGYSEDQAYRRIAAMRLVKIIPEIEEKISSGEISLSHIGVADTLFRKEAKFASAPMSREQKLQVIEQISNKPIRVAEKIALSFSTTPVAEIPDRIESISADCIEIKFVASAELKEKLERLKGILAHQQPDVSLGTLFEKLCDLGINEWKKDSPATSRKRCVTDIPSKAEIRRRVFRKADNQCENCGSQYALEIDHILPVAKGGGSNPENLRLLCRNCNQRAAIQEFGVGKVDKYISL